MHLACQIFRNVTYNFRQIAQKFLIEDEKIQCLLPFAHSPALLPAVSRCSWNAADAAAALLQEEPWKSLSSAPP